MTDTYLSAEFHSSVDLETEFISCSVGFNLVDIDTLEEIEIGKAILYLINIDRYDNWNEIVFAADGITGDLFSIVDGLEGVIEDTDFVGLIAILDHIKIYEPYRNKGYGTEGIEEIIKYLEITSVDYLAVMPSPYEIEDKNKKKAETKRLVKFYNRFKLEVVNSKSNSNIIMGRNLNYL